MASQINCKPQQVVSLVTHDKLISLRSLDKGKSSVVAVRVIWKWEELDFRRAKHLGLLPDVTESHLNHNALIFKNELFSKVHDHI
ncbi:hypothetical protein MKW92_048392 [Papaver armeniacum]|nr:hypothetical protein MKW92_048392 [Papaver armeniacum]